MSDFRRDPVSGNWVIIAPERAARPTDFPIERRHFLGGFCPFCEGNETRTPPEIDAIRSNGSAPNTPGWRVRVVPNRFPALHAETEVASAREGLYERMSGHGVAEVLIEHPEHLTSLVEMDNSIVSDILRVYRRRMASLRSQEQLVYGLLFKNVGSSAGATLEHSHTQLIATPVIPHYVQEEQQNCRDWYAKNKECLFCALIEEERKRGDRIVFDGEHFVGFVPYAARVPFETWILPKRHNSQYEEQPEDTLPEMADALRKTLAGLDVALDMPAYNYLIHTAPFRDTCSEWYHWHLEIIPQVTRLAGFEWGTGFTINPVPPERAASFLRKAMA